MLILDFVRFIGLPAAITFLQGAERLRLEHTSCYDDKNWKIICTRDCHAASAGRRTKVFKLTMNHGQLMSFLCFSKKGRGEKQEKHLNASERRAEHCDTGHWNGRGVMVNGK